MYSVGVPEAAVGARGGVPVGELDFVEFVVAVLDFACAVGDEHRGEGFVEVVFLVIGSVDDADVARGEKLCEPVGGVGRKRVGLKLVLPLYGLVVKTEGVGADGLGAFYFGLGGGVAVEFCQFGAVEHIGEPQPQIGAAVGVVYGDGAAAYLDGHAEDFVRLGVVVFGALVAEVGMGHGEHGGGVVLAVAGVAVGGEDYADVVGVDAARYDMVNDKLLVEIFERWPDIEKRQGHVARGGDDAARCEELLRYDGVGL